VPERVRVGGHRVGLAVEVEVADRHRARVAARGDARSLREGAVAVAEQHAHVVRQEVAHGEVEVGVAVQVGHRDAVRQRAGGVVDRRGEGAVVDAEQDRDVVLGPDVVGRDEVDGAVVVEVGRGDVVGVAAHGIVHGRAEGAVARSEQDRDRAEAVRVGGRRIHQRVAVEVAQRDPAGLGHDGRGADRRGEAARAIAEQHRDRGRRLRVGGHDVEERVAVHEAHREAGGDRRHGVGRWRGEAAQAVAEQQRDDRRAAAGHDDVGVAVAVELTDGERAARGAGEARGRAERARARAQQHRDGAGARVGAHEVGEGVAVQQADGDLVRRVTHGVARRRSVAAGRQREQHRDRVSRRVRRDEVGPPVAVQVPGRDAVGIVARDVLLERVDLRAGRSRQQRQGERGRDGEEPGGTHGPGLFGEGARVYRAPLGPWGAALTSP
jgi:hypothetical protein